MRRLNRVLLALGLTWLLAGGCVTRLLHFGGVRERPAQGLHAGIPMAFSARVVGDKRPDYHSLRSVMESPRFKERRGDDLAQALSRYYSSTDDGLCRFWNSDESAGRPQVRGSLPDPVRIFNGYGWMGDGLPAGVWSGREASAHDMDYALRPGETLIRSQRNDGRFPFPASWRAYARKSGSGWQGAPGERAAPFRIFGNGRWIYEPNLAAEYLDFAAGVRERRGIGQNAEGLVGEGRCVIPFVSPYPFVSRPDFATWPVVFRDGAWITLRASGEVKVEVTDPLGNWTPVRVAAAGREEKIDISALLEARYSFDVRLTLGATARVAKFRFEGYLLTAPMSIPRLDEGVNVMTLKCKDRYGLATLPCERLPDFRKTAAVPLDKQAVIRNGVLRPGIDPWQVIAPKGKGPVQATFAFEAPAGETFSWFQVQASVVEGPAPALPHQVKMEWSGDGRTFKPLAGTVVHGVPRHVDCRIDAARILDLSGRTVQVRVTSDTPISGVEFVGHLAMGAALFVRPEITHRWAEGATECRFVAPPATDAYFFRCGPAPSGHVIEMRVPSFRGTLPD